MRSRDAAENDLVHQHGIWPLHGFYVNSWRNRNGKPYIIAPQGALSRYSFTTSVLRKKLAWAVYQKRNVQESACIHAVGPLEMQEAREAGYKGPVALIPNGISERWLSSSGSGERFRKAHGLPADKRIALFLSRITPKKGLPFMIESMASLRKDLGDWLFVIVGMDEFGHQRELTELAARLGVAELVRFFTPIFDQDKRDAYAAADLFILPSLSEGAPSVVLEALGARVPVITTHGCPWEELKQHSCGWWTSPNTMGIQQALQEAIRLDRRELRQMGDRGYELMRLKYSWSELGQRSLRLYDWLLHGGNAPDFVTLN